MSARTAFLNCITAKAEAQLDRTIDKITDPIKAKSIEYERGLTKKKLDEYKTAFEEVLHESVLPEEVKAKAEAVVRSYAEAHDARVRGNSISLGITEKLKQSINTAVDMKAPQSEVVKMLAWSTPSLRESGLIAPDRQFLSLGDNYLAESDFHRIRLANTYYHAGQEAKIFRSAESKAFGDEVTSELFAIGEGKSISKNADAVRVANEIEKYMQDMVTEIQSYGVPIPGKGLKNYFGTKAWFNGEKVRTLPEDVFVDRMVGWAESGKINKDRLNTAAGKDLTPADMRSFFSAIYQEAIGVTESKSAGIVGTKLANLSKSRTMGRVIEFTDAAAVKEFDTLMGWDKFYEKLDSAVENNVRVLASLKTFGPNRAAVVAAGQAAVARRFGKTAGSQFKAATDRSITHFGGGYENLLNPNTVSNIEGVKKLLAAAFLGSHTKFAMFTDALVNVPRAIARAGGSYFTPIRQGLLDIVNKAGEDAGARDIFLAQAYGVTENLLHAIHSHVRSTQSTKLHSMGAAAYKFVETASGNKLITNFNMNNIGRDFGMQLSNQVMHGQSTKAFESLLGGFGITKSDLKILKPLMSKEKNGFSFVDLSKVEPGNKEQADVIRKVFAARRKQLSAASPVRDDQWQAFVASASQGSASTQLAARMMNQFMGSVMSLLRQNLVPILKAPGGVKWKALAAYSTMMTTAGLMMIWFDNIRRGEDPEEISPSLLLKAFLLSGVTGPWGDMLRNSMDNPSKDADISTGPLIGAAVDLVKTGVSMAADKKGSTAKAIHKAGSFLPGGNLWWLQTLYKQGILDHLAEMADPAGQRDIERRRKSARKRRGTESFIEREAGDVLPTIERAPDLDNITPKG